MDIHYHTLVNYFLVIFIDLLFCCSGSKHMMIVANWSNSCVCSVYTIVCVVCLKQRLSFVIRYIFDIRDHSNFTYSNGRRGEWSEGNVFLRCGMPKKGGGEEYNSKC